MPLFFYPLFFLLLAHLARTAPVPVRLRTDAMISKRSTTSPHFFVYGDQDGAGFDGPPPADKLSGFNTYALAFLTTQGPQEKARQWMAMTEDERSQMVSSYHAAGIDIVVSVFGGVDNQVASGRYKETSGATKFANSVADWVQKYGVDGVDVDYEDYSAFSSGGGAVDWVVTFTEQLRARLPDSIISHTPLAFQFGPGGGNSYVEINNRVGDKISWYNVQYYNHGDRFLTCESLLEDDEVSVFRVADLGVPLSKIVIAKPANSNDAGQGVMEPSLLAQCVKQAKDKGWDAGIAVWQFPDANTDWIRTVRGDAFPMS